MDVADHGGEEGLHVILKYEKSIDVEELVPRSTEETHCLFGIGDGEVNLCPKARGRKQHIPPRLTDMRHRDQRSVHREWILALSSEKVGDADEDVLGESIYWS